MRTLMTVNDIMSIVKDGDYKYVVLVTACSEYEVYSDLYSNFPHEMKELDVTLIEFQSGCIKLYVLWRGVNMVSAIVCVDKNWGIGYNNKLLINIPEDMRFFKDKTKNGVIIMGRKTYDSLPSKPLPHKINIVITSKVDKLETDEKGIMFVSMDFIKTFLNTLSSESPIDYYVIGGGKIYNELLPYCSKAYVTKVNISKNADTYFPNLDNLSEWEVSETSDSKTYNGFNYKFYTYKNKEVQKWLLLDIKA